MIILYVHIAHPCLHLFMMQHIRNTSLPTVPGPKSVPHWYGVLMLVKQTRLWASNVVGHGTDCLVLVRPKSQS